MENPLQAEVSGFLQASIILPYEIFMLESNQGCGKDKKSIYRHDSYLNDFFECGSSLNEMLVGVLQTRNIRMAVSVDHWESSHHFFVEIQFFKWVSLQSMRNFCLRFRLSSTAGTAECSVIYARTLET